jgi:hypothetical protein
VFSAKIVDHGSRHGDAMQELTRWRHPVASSEALDKLHQAMCPAWHRRIRMVIEIVVGLPAFFCIDFIVGHNHKLKTMVWSI